MCTSVDELPGSDSRGYGLEKYTGLRHLRVRLECNRKDREKFISSGEWTRFLEQFGRGQINSAAVIAYHQDGSQTTQATKDWAEKLQRRLLISAGEYEKMLKEQEAERRLATLKIVAGPKAASTKPKRKRGQDKRPKKRAATGARKVKGS